MIQVIIGIFICTLILSCLSGFLLQFNDPTLEKYQNKYLLLVIRKVNFISSTLILSPLQVLLNLLITLLLLWIIFISFYFIDMDERIKVYFCFTIWLTTLQFIPKQVFDLVRIIINKQIFRMQISKNVSDYINYFFYRKVFAYFIAASFVIYNTVITIIGTQQELNENVKILLSITNSSVITYLAIDRIIEGFKKWKKT